MRLDTKTQMYPNFQLFKKWYTFHLDAAPNLLEGKSMFSQRGLHTVKARMLDGQDRMTHWHCESIDIPHVSRVSSVCRLRD